MHEPGVAPVGPERPVNDPLNDQRALQILSTEHWSLLTARSLAYNEVLTRASMFMALLSMSFVGLALLAQAMDFSREFLLVAGLVLGFDFLVGMLTFIRVGAASMDDFRAMQGMNRVRHAYLEMAPGLERYFVTGRYDDPDSVGVSYGFQETRPRSSMDDVLYGLSTSLGLVGLIEALLGGLLGGVVALMAGAPGWLAVLVALATGVLVLLVAIGWAMSRVARHFATLDVRFPSPEKD